MAGSADERTPVMRDGKVVLTALALQVAQMEQGFGLVRIGGESLPPGRLGLSAIALRQARGAPGPTAGPRRWPRRRQ